MIVVSFDGEVLNQAPAHSGLMFPHQQAPVPNRQSAYVLSKVASIVSDRSRQLC
jgi:hypothetical protein